MPISRLSVTSCVGLELRPLPSTGVTRRQRYYGPLRHPRGNPACGVGPGLSLAGRPHGWGYPRVEGHAPSPHGFPVLRSISVYRHAVVNTPVARWGLIARGTAYSNRFPGPSGGGLPHLPARSATTLDVSRPAQRSLAITACRLAESPKRPVCLEGSDGFVTSTAAPIATGWSDPVAGWELHPLKTNTSRFTAHRYGVPGTPAYIESDPAKPPSEGHQGSPRANSQLTGALRRPAAQIGRQGQCRS